MVPLDEAKVRCPEIVIDYLSGLISWVKKNEEKEKWFEEVVKSKEEHHFSLFVFSSPNIC